MGELRFAPDALSGVARSDTGKILDKILWLWEQRTLVVHHPLRHDLTGFYKRVIGKYRIVYV